MLLIYLLTIFLSLEFGRRFVCSSSSMHMYQLNMRAEAKESERVVSVSVEVHVKKKESLSLARDDVFETVIITLRFFHSFAASSPVAFFHEWKIEKNGRKVKRQKLLLLTVFILYTHIHTHTIECEGERRIVCMRASAFYVSYKWGRGRVPYIQQ